MTTVTMDVGVPLNPLKRMVDVMMVVLVK